MKSTFVLMAHALGLSVFAASAGAAQQGEPFRLTVENIMRGEGLVGRSPSEVRWAADSRHLFFRWREPEARDTTTRTYRVGVRGGAPQPLADSVSDRIAPGTPGDWSRDRRLRAAERGGDVWIAWANGAERRITDTPARERSPQVSPDGHTAYWLSGNNVFAMAIAGGPVRQLTDIRLDDRPQDKPAEGQRRFLESQQTELFGVIRDRVREREHGEALDSVRTRVQPSYLGKTAAVARAEVSPSGRFVLLGVSTRAEERQTLIPNFVTESGYTETVSVRSKVGDVQTGQRAAILDPASGAVRWIEPPRAGTTTLVDWAPAGDQALLIAIAADFKDRWILLATPDGKTTVLDHLRDEAWVAGPGVFTAGWLPDGQRIYFVSERTGYAHLYTVPAGGGTATALTSGSWEVHDVQLGPRGDSFFVTSNEIHPGERHLYAVPVGGGARQRIDRLPGWNEAYLSPDGRWVALLHSTGNRPPELFLQPSRPGAAARQLTRSTTREFQAGPWIDPEVITYPARDGARVYARIYRPRDLGVQPNGAAVVFVHGAGYLQNAHRGWSTYFREYMFHHLLASRGFTVLDADFRASAGYGRDWRTGIHRHMGGKDLTDQVDGVRYLVELEGIDPARVGIYGGSYGGFITLMAMFTEPDVFRSGAALRSVTDWAHYNHPYTARILGEPQADSAAYRRSSPIYFAEGLQGDLLIAHGMMDTNVHFQDVVRLTQRLIELGKEDWELAVYPVEDHAFVRPESWTDEYRRILELFQRTLGR